MTNKLTLNIPCNGNNENQSKFEETIKNEKKPLSFYNSVVGNN